MKRNAIKKRKGVTFINPILFLSMVSLVFMMGSCCKPEIKWSGYWWPQKSNSGCNLYSTNGPAEKYDKYVQATTGTNPGWQQWEKQHHDDGPGVEGWWGHCHALSSASILEPEPCKSKTKDGITFSILDQKGMLVECHYDDPAAIFVFTTSAVDFHENLIKFVGNPQTKERKPIVMDKNPGDEVWNYVIVDYKMTWKTDSADSTRSSVTCKVTYLNYGPCDSDYTGRIKSYVTYTYWVKGDFEKPSTGEWTGDSVDNHPHFFWYPDYQKVEAGCPIDYNVVKHIIQ